MAVGMLAACGDDDDTSATTTSEPEAAAPASTSTTGAPLPDLGGRLLFSRFNERTHEFNSTHIANPDGTDEVELTLPGPEGGARWSSDGEHIAVMTVLDDGRIGTAILRPDGAVERTLAIPDATLNLVCVTWSPDDRRLACEGWDDDDESRRGIYVVNSLDGQGLQRLTAAPAGLADFPGDFAPDGTTLVFTRNAGEADGPLMMIDVTGGEPRQLGSGAYEDPGRFSPDGLSVATSSQGAIVVVDLEGSVRHEIKRTGDYLFGPAWSPDGEWLGYSGASVGPHADLFISRLDGSEVHRITDTPENEIVLEWSHPG